MFSGEKVWTMSDTDLRLSMADLVDYIARDFEERPTYEEFRQAVQDAIEQWFEELEEQKIYRVIYYPPLGEGEPIYISNVESFMYIVEERFGLKDVYEDYFGQESSQATDFGSHY